MLPPLYLKTAVLALALSSVSHASNQEEPLPKDDVPAYSMCLLNIDNSEDVATLDAQTEKTRQANQQLESTFEKMVTWWEEYVNSKPFTSQYDEFSKEFIAEATFWSVSLGLDAYINTVSYSDICQFSPMVLRMEKSKIGQLINTISYKMRKPSTSFEGSYALGQAAWSIFVHHHSWDEMKALEKDYTPPS